MAEGGQPGERLRQYLRQLSPGARALLIAELERALLRGEEVPGGDFVLQEVRRAVREFGVPAPRIGNPARLFFRPIEPFLVDDTAAHKHQGRIARVSLEPIWAWIGRDLLPAEAKTFAEEVSRALLADGAAACERLSCDFQDRVVDRIRHVLAAAQSDDKARRRLAGQIGTGQALDDVGELRNLLEARDMLALIADRLPRHIRNLADAHLDAVKAVLDSPVSRQANILPYALVLVMSRLEAPWQLIRLAVKAAQSDDAARIAATPYAAAVVIVLAEIERMVGELKTDLRRGGGVPVTSLLKGLHDGARGLRTELDLAVELALGPPARRHSHRDFEPAEGRDRVGTGPRAALVAAAAGQRDRARQRARPGRRRRHRGADPAGRRLSQLCGRACHQRDDDARSWRAAATSRHRHQDAARRIA